MTRIRNAGTIVLLLAAIWLWQAEPAAAEKCSLHAGDAGYVCDYTIPPTFVEPTRDEDSFLNKRLYGKLADFTNVYAQPSRSAAVVRNVGDGFLYSSLHGGVDVNGERWYIINPGEYVNEADIRLVDISQFSGMQVLRQPERPFGWIVAEVRPSTTPNGPTRTLLPRLERYTFFEVYDAVEASDGWIWYDIGNGRWVRQTFVSLIDVTQRPEGVGPDEWWVEIDLYEQTLAAYEGDRMVYASLISSGLNRWPTHEGLFEVYDRWSEIKMSGAEGEIDYYFVEDVPHTMYFNYDIALHGAYWHDRFGYKHSHGCVNIPPYGAEWLFDWSAENENALRVWVHTSDPYYYFDKFADAHGGQNVNNDGKLFENHLVVN